MGVREEFFSRSSFILGNKTSVGYVLEDTWLGDMPLSHEYPSLHNATVFTTIPLNTNFRRTLSDDKWTSWLCLVECVMMAQLSVEPDMFAWRFTSSCVFTVKSICGNLDGHAIFILKYLWKINVPLKIKIFLWFLNRKVLLRITFLRGADMGVRNVVSVTLMRLSNIYFSRAISLDLFYIVDIGIFF